jgi:hypothetical protein
MAYICNFCKKKFTSKSNLNYHQINTKYCLEIQGSTTLHVECDYCKKNVGTTKILKTHLSTCKEYAIYTNQQHLEEKINFLQDELKKKELIIKELQDKLENIAIKAVSRPMYDVFDDPSTILIEEENNNESSENEEEYKLTPLEIGQGYTIEHREEDGFINVTNLCKAGDKQFKHWFSLLKTKAFLRVLSSSVGIPTNELIKYNTGSNSERSTWTHPQVAINIAQWISPTFDVKVSGWVYEVMMTGKVDITNTKSYKELQKENKNKELKIQFLTKKYVKRQPRVDYQERNVVYILTTANMKKERRYILGKAENLTNRLSVYNKSDEHEVIYYQECSDEDKMNIVETTVFNKLKECREQANRERFILPENKEIEYFKDTIKKVIEFVN